MRLVASRKEVCADKSCALIKKGALNNPSLRYSRVESMYCSGVACREAAVIYGGNVCSNLEVVVAIYGGSPAVSKADSAASDTDGRHSQITTCTPPF